MRRIIFLIFIFLLFLLGQKESKALIIKTCIDCHPLNKFKGPKVHKPLKNCFNCHTGHISKYPKLLINKMPDLCYDCHPQILEKQKQVERIHYPLQKGKCLKCHNAHKGEKVLLKASLKKVCFDCHKIKTSFKVLHIPFKQGNCNTCHSSHYSDESYLLKSKSICLNCHSLSVLSSSHLYLKKGKNCRTCHNPHGAEKKGLLKEIAHKPYKEGKCKECHSENIKGNNMCFKCHSKIKKEFAGVYNHYLPASQGKPFCIECHSPHLSDQKYLLKAQAKSVCLNCHREAVIQKAETLYVHKDWENCLLCHKGHGSNVRGMLRDKEMKLCGSCHKRHINFTHPIGEKIRDPRNGQATSCMTCHDPMGVDYKYLLRLSGERELCIECHKGY